MDWLIKSFKYIILLVLLLSGISCKITEDDSFKVKVSDTSKKVKIKNVVKIGYFERTLLQKSLILVHRLDDEQGSYPYLPKYIYWADLSDNFLGLTIFFKTNSLPPFLVGDNRVIFMDKQKLFINRENPIEWLKLGMTLNHELHHYFYNSKDPDTGKLTDDKLQDSFKNDQLFLIKLFGYWKEIIN